MVNPPGSTAPGSVTTTRSPTAKLVAPQMMPRTWSPTSTWHHRMGFFRPWRVSNSWTRPTTIGPVSSGGRWTSSISRPTRTNASAVSSTGGSSPMCSASQDSGTRTLSPSWADSDAERAAEPPVAPDTAGPSGGAAAELERALQAHAEREPGVLLGVDAAGAQDVGVDHAAAAPLDPAGPALLLREPDVDLGGRLGEREERGPQPGARRRPEHGARERVEGPLEVGHRDAAVDREPLHLVEHRGVGGVEGVGAERAAGAHHVDGQLPLQQGADLHRGGVGAQHHAGALGLAQVEGVLHRARGVVLAEV